MIVGVGIACRTGRHVSSALQCCTSDEHVLGARHFSHTVSIQSFPPFRLMAAPLAADHPFAPARVLRSTCSAPPPSASPPSSPDGFRRAVAVQSGDAGASGCTSQETR